MFHVYRCVSFNEIEKSIDTSPNYLLIYLFNKLYRNFKRFMNFETLKFLKFLRPKKSINLKQINIIIHLLLFYASIFWTMIKFRNRQKNVLI